MPTQIQLRRGSYAQHQAFTGAVAEPTFDTSNKVMRIHDNTTPGGLEMVMGNTLYKSTPVKVVSTSNITLSDLKTIDGVSVVAGDRVLVIGQSDQTKNGIYIVQELPSVWSRAWDFDKIGNIQRGMLVYVSEGSTHNETVWKLTTQPTTLELHNITFEKWLGVETRGLAQNTVSGLVVRQSKGNYTSRAVTVAGQGITVTNGDGISGNPLLSLNSTPNNVANAIMARDSTGSFVAQNAVLNGNLTVNGIVIDGGSLVGSTSVFNLVSQNALTINFGDVATNITAGASGSNGTFRIKNDNVVLDGNLTVNGTTLTTNSTVVTIDDPIMTLGGDTAPTSDDSKDRGIEFRYFNTTAKKGFFGWDNSQGKYWLLKDATNTSEIFSGTLADLQIADLAVDGGDVTTTQTTFNLVDTTATTLNLAGAATTLNIGASGGTTTLRSSTLVGTGLTQNLYNTVATTVNAFGAATSLTLGGTSGTATVRNTTLAVNNNLTVGGNSTFTGTLNITNATESYGSSTGAITVVGGIGVKGNISCDGTFAILGDVAVNGGDFTTDDALFNFLQAGVTTLNIGGETTTINMGASGGNMLLRNNTVYGTDATTNLWNTVATTVNAFGAASNINIGAAGGTTTLRSSTLVGTGTTQNLYNTVATTLNIGGASTALTLGATTGTATIRNSVVAINNAATIGSTLSVTGATTLSSTLAVSSNTTVGGTLGVTGATTLSSTLAVSSNTTVGGTLTVTGDTTTVGNIALNGGNLTTTSSTAALFNANATTVNIAGAATTVNIGSSSGNTNVNNNLVVAGNLTVNGTTTTINSTTLSVDDLNIVLADGAANAAAANGAGITISGANATFVYQSSNDTWVLNKNLNTLGVTGATTLSSTLGVTGAATLSSTLAVSGVTTLSNNASVGGTFIVTGATTLSSTLGVTGATSLSSLSVSSNATVAGTLGVTGVTTLGVLNASGSTLGSLSVSGTSAHTGAATFASTLAVSGATTLASLNAGTTYATSLSLGAALPIGSGGTGATTAQGARTNLLPSQSAGQAGYVLTTNGTDVSWNYLGNAMVTTFNGRSNAVTLTSGDVTGALGFTPLSSTSGTAISAGYLTGKDAFTNGTDGWFRSNGNAGWYSTTYSVGIYATQAGWVSTYGSAQMMANGFQIASDIRIKDNIVDSKYGLDTVLQLRSVEYDRKSDGQHDIGLIAQEVEEIIPEFVHTDPEGMKSVNYPQMVSVLIKAVQELKAEVDDLKQQLGK